MKKKVISLILSILIIFMCIPNITYAAPTETNPFPLGPAIRDLKGSEEINTYLQEIKRIRANLITINILASSTTEELQNIDSSLDTFINSFNNLKDNLASYKEHYKDSFWDTFLAEQLSFISTAYNMSLLQQKYLISALKNNEEGAKPLFYSSYLLGVYYYLSLADQMLSYIDSYYPFH